MLTTLLFAAIAIVIVVWAIKNLPIPEPLNWIIGLVVIVIIVYWFGSTLGVPSI